MSTHKISVFFFVVLSSILLNSTSAEPLWIWQSGSSTTNQAGVYGTKGVAAPDNVPGARLGSVSWTDNSGNFWLFGGYGNAASGVGYLNDLWKFDGTNWTWVGGSNAVNQIGVYGTKGVAAWDNVPGAHGSSVSWTDSSGNLWLFGGSGYAASGQTGKLNDLWKFDGTEWTWVGGSNVVDQYGVYGTKGVASWDNVPGARSGPISWIDSNDDLWLFGGNGNAASGSGYLNDLWKFDGTNWTWISGSNTASQAGVYGTKGVAASGNMPGTRGYSVSWTDSSGNLWLFGGYGFAASGNGPLNDLWKFDGTNWTWVGGSNSYNQAGVYGTKGVADSGNVPGGRSSSVSWTDTSGNFWLFGGSNGYGFLNDLWKFDGSNWTWISGANIINQPGVYGTKGVAASGNVPGARYSSVSWIDAGGNLWLFGGSGRLNDLWKFEFPVIVPDVVGMTQSAAQSAIVTAGLTVGTVSSEYNTAVPAGSVITQSPTAGSIVSVGSAVNIGVSLGPDPCKAMWTWVGGSNTIDQYGVYGTKGVAAWDNVPGARYASVSWTDSGGNLWLFGGNGYAASGSGLLNDLWKFDGTDWTWISGSNTVSQVGVYGTKGVADWGNVPGARYGSVSWNDSSGNLWLFGGIGYSASGIGYLNDLWKFDGTNWTWVGGSNTINQYGVYGTKGVADSGNVPGARQLSTSCIDSSGNFWLFGGAGYAVSSNGYLNDLWKFDGTNWTWLGGSNTTTQHSVYGTKGVAAPDNVPGRRYRSNSWIDAESSFWLFGGEGFSTGSEIGRLNDLWKFDGANWTWFSGSDVRNQPGVYGSKGVAASSNVPGGRDSPTSWIAGNGDFWLFGGAGYAISGSGYLNDLWKFDGTNWTWIGGSNTIDQPGVYGTKGVAAWGNIPGGRYSSVSWIDAGGNLWLFGGNGLATSSYDYLNDLWKFGIPKQATDIDENGVVNDLDLMMLVNQWLTSPTGMPSADIAPSPTGDGIVNLPDFAFLARHWLEEF